jgi:hypothetical protein
MEEDILVHHQLKDVHDQHYYLHIKLKTDIFQRISIKPLIFTSDLYTIHKAYDEIKRFIEIVLK